MSSWYVLSAIGLYPACPGSGEYLLSEPLFDRVQLNIFPQTFTIQKQGKTDDGSLPTLLLDGKKHNQWFLSHKELMNHHSLVYEASQPNSDYSSLIKPLSLTQETPSFKAQFETPHHQIISSGMENWLPFEVHNSGESGLFVAQLKENDKVIAEKSLLVESQHTAQDTIRFTAYSIGKHALRINDKTFTLEVQDSAFREQPFTCLKMEAASLTPLGTPFTLKATVQNKAGRRYKDSLPIHVNSTSKNCP